MTFPAGAPGQLPLLGLARRQQARARRRSGSRSRGRSWWTPPGGSPPDRVLVINIWGSRIDSTTLPQRPGHQRPLLALHRADRGHRGRHPALAGAQQQLAQSSDASPRLLLPGRGAGRRLRRHALLAAARRLVVTEGMRPHHDLRHVLGAGPAGQLALPLSSRFPCGAERPAQSSAGGTATIEWRTMPAIHMAGLVLGIAVRPRPGSPEPARGRARRLHLFVQEGMKRGRAPRALGFVLQRGARPPAADSVEIPGSPLVLTRGQPTDIVIVEPAERADRHPLARDRAGELLRRGGRLERRGGAAGSLGRCRATRSPPGSPCPGRGPSCITPT